MKQRLLDALRSYSRTEWGAAALAALDDPGVVFAGSPGSGASNTAGDLLRIYRVRHAHCQEKAIAAQGLSEIIASLVALSPSTVIQAQPFLGRQISVSAFWDSAGNLVGCITVLGLDPERGRRNLEFANGQS